MTLRSVVLPLLWASSLVLSFPAEGAGASVVSAARGAPNSGTLTKANEEVPRRFVRGEALKAIPDVDGEVRARAFIADIRGRFDLSSDDELVLSHRSESRTGEHFLFSQSHRGVPVLGAFVAVHVDLQGAVALAVNETSPGLSVDVTPRITRENALERARQRVGVTEDSYHAPPQVVLAVTRENALVWRVLLPADVPFGDWEVIVDAVDGTIASVRDLVVSFTTGQGAIFDPNPVVTLRTQALSDQDDSAAAIPPGAYIIAPLLGLNGPSGGFYRLQGEHCSIEDFELPSTIRAQSASPIGFLYDRGDDRFEEVNVYYQVDSAIRHLRELGFDQILTHPVSCDAHGLNGVDDSHYVPSTKRVAYGDGCVDDGEDAEVIWHELGHAVQDDQVPGWVGTGESGAMGEGFADFFAVSLSYDVSGGYGVEQVFDWDRGPVDGCWAGRRVDSTKHYPQDMTGEVHADGEIWSATLWQIAVAYGWEHAVTLAIEAHWMVPLGGTFEDGAVAILLADKDLYGGVDIPTILDVFANRGIIAKADFAPAIAHVPPQSTDDTIGPYVITAQVENYAPIAADSVCVSYRTGGGAFINAAMIPTGTGGEYAFSLPGVPLGTSYSYSFHVSDVAGLSTNLPAPAGTYYSFSVEEDSQAPQISHTPITEAPIGTWPPRLSAVITDAHGVDSVQVAVRLNGMDAGTFTVPRVADTDTFAMDLPVDAASVGPDDWVEYRLIASDASAHRNKSYAPGPTQYYGFSVLNAAGRALVVDDDTGGTPVLTTDLQTAGFLVTTVTPGALSASSLDGYDFAGWAAGNNLGPLANATARGVIEDYVASGGKLVIEGGEVGFDALTLYPSFAANVLHLLTYGGTFNAGNIRPLPWKKTHPVLYLPNVLPSIISCNYAGNPGNMDPVHPAPDATLLAEYVGAPRYVGPGYAGILVYDGNDAPQSGQVVYCAFNIAQIVDANVRRALVSNIGHYLTAKEGAAQSAIAGTVQLVGGPPDRSGTVVRSLTEDAIAFTNQDGTYRLEGLHSTPQLLVISHAGYETLEMDGETPPEGGTLAGTDAELRPVDTFAAFTTPYAAIPDNSPTGVTSSVDCTMDGTVFDVLVSVVIHHSYIGDLILDLRSPSGTTVRLHNRMGKGEDNIITTFDTDCVPDGPGSLDDFTGTPSQGVWSLTVSDNQSVETGTFDSWTLTVTSLRPTTGSPEQPAPAYPYFAAPSPNPTGASVEFAYSIPKAGRVRLVVYGPTGREVAVLADGPEAAGRHRLRWDARNASGRRVSAGVYFCRFQADGLRETRKLVVVD